MAALLATIFAAFAATGGGAAQSFGRGLLAAAGAQSTGGKVVLRSQVLPGLTAHRSTGTPVTGQRISIAVGLRDRDPAGEARLLSALYDPRSPQYHRFLRPADSAERFSPTPGQYRAVEDWLQGGGLAITGTSAARDVVWADGTSAQVDRLLNTRLETFHAAGRDFYANVSPPAVPSDLDVMSVVGLNSWQHFSIPSAVHGTPSPGRSLTPQDLWGVYDQPATNTGQGQTMAIFGAGRSDAAVSNLRAFESFYKLRRVPVRTIYTGNGPFVDQTADDLEWNLDTQASTGMAPDVLREDLYFAATLADADVLSAFTQWVDDDVDPQASASFGECEVSPADPTLSQQTGGAVGNGLEPVAEQILARANLQGQTLFSSTGDNGAFCPTVNPPVNVNGIAYTGDPRLNYPSASPYAVAVGGTVVYTDSADPGQRSQEIGWTHGGGGNSLFLPAGPYQAQVVRSVCVTDTSGGTGATGTPCRGTPDVAAMSGDLADGYQICQPDCNTGAVGTSLSSPLWLGMWTRVQAAAKDQVHRNGFANYVLYRVGQNPLQVTRDYYDITVGFNGLYTALPGWDNVSGWGAPDLTSLMYDVDGGIAPVDDVYPPALVQTPLAGSLLLPSACGPLWAKAPHQVFDRTGAEQRQLELVSGSISLSPDGNDLQVQVNVGQAPASGKVDGGPFAAGSDSDIWIISWQYSNQTYFAAAQLDVTGSVQFRDGVVTTTPAGQTSFTPNYTNDGGALNARTGVIEIDVPRAHVGSPAFGDVLASPAAITEAGDTIPNAAGGGGTSVGADSGGPRYDYVVGQQCGTPQAAMAGNSWPGAPRFYAAAPRATASGSQQAGGAGHAGSGPAGSTKKAKIFDPNGVDVHALRETGLLQALPRLPDRPAALLLLLVVLLGAGAALALRRLLPGR